MADLQPEIGPARPPPPPDDDIQRQASPFSLDRQLLRELSIPQHIPPRYTFGVPDSSLTVPSPASSSALTPATALAKLLDAKHGKAGFDAPEQVHFNYRLANDRQVFNRSRRLERLVTDVFGHISGLHAYGSNLADVWKLDDVLSNIYLPEENLRETDNDRFAPAGKMVDDNKRGLVTPEVVQRKSRWDQIQGEQDSLAKDNKLDRHRDTAEHGRVRTRDRERDPHGEDVRVRHREDRHRDDRHREDRHREDRQREDRQHRQYRDQERDRHRPDRVR
ncbi:uncharacterized protein V1513DRAFT_413993 [Lipomyces chichibuensis]|uniref:uncharacterized protein n=1 Tax=Lipomyces chichibuensis TaxID=1546026 RepID=UPI003343DF05